MALTELTHIRNLDIPTVAEIVRLTGVTVTSFAGPDSTGHWFYENFVIPSHPTFQQVQNAMDAVQDQAVTNITNQLAQDAKWQKLLRQQGIDGITIAIARAIKDIATITGASSANITAVINALAYYDAP